MGLVVIGMDPHKRSATIEVMAADEAIVGGGRYATDAAGYRAMLAGARQWPERVWAVEGCQGIGRHLASRLLADGEQVIDVPAKLSARMRVFATGQGRKTDATDAHSIALAATRRAGLRPVVNDQQLAVLRILADRRRALGEDHTRMVCQLHHLLLELIPGGAKKDLSAAQAKALLAKARPRDAAGRARRRVAAELISDLERLYQRKKATNKELNELLSATGSTLTTLHGIGPSGAARLLVEVGGIARFPSKAHFASWNGTAPTGRLFRRPGPPPPVPGRQPPGQPRLAHHGRRPAPPPRQRGPRLLRPQSRRREDDQGSDARSQTAAVRHRLPPDAPRSPGSANGSGRTHGGGYWLQRGRLQPQRRRFGKSLPGPARPRPYAQTPTPSPGRSRHPSPPPDRSRRQALPA